MLGEEVRCAGSWQLADDQPTGVLVREAFEILIRKRFSRDTDVRVITSWVDEVHQVANRVHVLAGEALVRRALGETDVVVEDIPEGTKLICRLLLFVRACADLRHNPVSDFDENTLDKLLVEAEGRVSAMGLHPPLRPPEVGETQVG
jgi:hypothetical protein